MKHICMCCGTESECVHGNWRDRHPVATVVLVLIGLVGVVFWAAILATDPVVAIALLGVGTLAACAKYADREHKRRSALRMRADYQDWLIRTNAKFTK